MDEFWKKRIENIKDHVNLRDLVNRFNVECKSDGNVTQLHCPFHGKDNHASARLYDTNTMYCWVCSKSWDVVTFVKDFKQIKFSEACKFLENLYGLQKIDVSIAYKEPSFIEYLNEKNDVKKEKDFDNDFQKITKILMRNKFKVRLDEYVRLFYHLDTLYSSYKLNKYPGDLSLQLDLDNLYQEVVNIT